MFGAIGNIEKEHTLFQVTSCLEEIPEGVFITNEQLPSYVEVTPGFSIPNERVNGFIAEVGSILEGFGIVELIGGAIKKLDYKQLASVREAEIIKGQAGLSAMHTIITKTVEKFEGQIDTTLAYERYKPYFVYNKRVPVGEGQRVFSNSVELLEQSVYLPVGGMYVRKVWKLEDA